MKLSNIFINFQNVEEEKISTYQNMPKEVLRTSINHPLFAGLHLRPLNYMEIKVKLLKAISTNKAHYTPLEH